MGCGDYKWVGSMQFLSGNQLHVLEEQNNATKSYSVVIPEYKGYFLSFFTLIHVPICQLWKVQCGHTRDVVFATQDAVAEVMVLVKEGAKNHNLHFLEEVSLAET